MAAGARARGPGAFRPVLVRIDPFYDIFGRSDPFGRHSSCFEVI